MTRVLVWTEQHAVGGNDRFLGDLLGALPGGLDVRLAGVPNQEWDAWLAARVPWAVPKVDVPVVTLANSPLNRLRPAGSDGGPPVELSSSASEVPLALRAAAAALRYRQAAFNLVRLERVFRRARPDVLFVNNGGWPGAETCRWAPVAAKRAGVRRVVHFVHNMPSPPHWPPVLERRIDRAVDAAVDAWVTGARRASQALREQAGMTAVHTVHYGHPPAAPAAPARDVGFGFGDGSFNVAMVAAFERRKGHAVLLEAARALGPGFRFALAGEGQELERVRAAAAGLPNVRLVGRRSDVPAILAAADALVLPSLSNECLPYAILEAMAAGLPCVGTDVAGIPEEIEHGKTGFVVAPGDAGALAGALAELAADRERAAAMGAAGARRVREHFSIERMVAEIIALWTP